MKKNLVLLIGITLILQSCYISTSKKDEVMFKPEFQTIRKDYVKLLNAENIESKFEDSSNDTDTTKSVIITVINGKKPNISYVKMGEIGFDLACEAYSNLENKENYNKIEIRFETPVFAMIKNTISCHFTYDQILNRINKN